MSYVKSYESQGHDLRHGFRKVLVAFCGRVITKVDERKAIDVI